MIDLRSELAWLFEEFEYLLSAVEDEYGGPRAEDRHRAKDIQAQLKTMPLPDPPKN